MTSTQRSIASRVIDIIAEQWSIDASKIGELNRLRDDLGCDSFGEIELIMTLEDEFQIDIPDGDIGSIQTVGQAISYIQTATQGP